MAAAGLQDARLACGDHRRAQIEAGHGTPRSLRQTISHAGNAGRDG